MDIPIGDFVEKFIQLLLNNFQPFFDAQADYLNSFMDNFGYILLSIPPLFFIIVLSLIAWFLVNKKTAAFTALGLLLIFGMKLWQLFIETFVLVILSTSISLIIGIPIGILMSKRKVLNKIILPILDFMQTMPSFVYLIPAVMFFGIGNVPGIISTVIFSMPPAVRLTKLGLEQVPNDLEEVGRAFGLTNFQMLYKIKLPLALPSIMAGINQSIMMALSMVVAASMIGTRGLGSQVLSGIQRNDIGIGFEAGLAVVILAIILDRITRSLGLKTQNKNA
ncbi:proline/glycine betaine ABC transporter permease [Clostridium sporogenes]|nr:proline/glycine betaine ABC transporter permease [Clostridium cochlearium]MBE6064497.1 proline/glycine betaine ABC transporter permease [Clostridium cochlearium]MBU5269529.1 proline/glycine betaine ABC transporter permease [Clostridium cochlearium]MDU1443035.1 proline/glycine betaine ABC transporter permease [Clostridium cochlearium]NOH15527.1 proline/glycine betaine ABC transporter permease [Clostridium cochlearium]